MADKSDQHGPRAVRWPHRGGSRQDPPLDVREGGGVLRKLRRGFILTNMALVTAVLLVVFTVVMTITYQGLRTEVDHALEEAVGTGPKSFAIPTVGGIGSSSATIGSNDSSTQDLTAGSDTTDGSKTADNGVDKNSTTATQGYQNSYVPVYCVTVDDSGTITATNDSSVSMSSDIAASAISEALASSSDSGVLADLSLYYERHASDDGSITLAFADRSVIVSSLTNIVLKSLIIGVGALAAFLLISILLARQALRPVEEAWKRQRQFIADASHELKTPLTVILANSEILLKDRDGLSPDHRKWVQSTCDEAQGMRILTEDLLSMAKVEEAPPVPREAQQVDFSQLAEKTVLQFEAVAFEQAVSFEEDIAAGVVVRGEEAQLESLLRALVENACKYAGAGGDVSITLVAKQGSAVFTVRNTGKVIDSADLPHVFERFYRSDKARLHGEGSDVEDGFGLGLAIAKSIVEAHHGTIDVTSSEQAGTVFTVRLPLWAKRGGHRHPTSSELHG